MPSAEGGRTQAGPALTRGVGWVIFPGRVPPWGSVAAAGPRGAGALRADVPGAQRHGGPGRLRSEAGPRLRVPPRVPPQPGGPLCDRRPLRMLAPRAAPPGETPGPRRATWPFSARPPSRPYSGPPRPTPPLKFSLPLPAHCQPQPFALAGPPAGFGVGQHCRELIGEETEAEPSVPPTPCCPQPGSEWQEACATCRCLGGRSVCTQHCPPLTCAQVPACSPAAPRAPDSLLGPSLEADLRAGWGLTTLSAGRGGPAGARELLSLLSPGDSWYGGDLGRLLLLFSLL